MKNLKYLQLFEAFESQKLSKTLKFINKGARENFMQAINRIANRFDFPLSKFNDDMFEYLPFKSALKKNVPPPKQPEREVCNRESDWIPGEFCQGGRVKRTWGAHTRMTECPGCSGTGFKPLKKVAPEVSLLKFWFDKDGNFVTVTGCDGSIRTQNPRKVKYEYTHGDLHEFSRNENDYNRIRELSLSEIKSLPTGTIVLFATGDQDHNRELAVSMVFSDGQGILGSPNSKVYMLQDKFSGDTPDEDLIPEEEWRKYAGYSWVVVGRGDLGVCYLLEPKVKSEIPKKEIREFPQEMAYDWNNIIDLRYFQMANQRDMEERLKNAHFAIILDLNKLKESEFEKLSSTKSERELRKAGAFLKPEEVKNANIERYLNLLIKRFDANKGLSELTKVLPRAFGYTNMLTFVIRGFNFRDMDEMINALYSFMRHPNSSEKTIIYYLSNIYETSRSRCETVNTTTDEVWKLLDKGGNGKMLDEKSRKYFQTYCEISELLFKKVQSEKIETLTDIETLMTKLRSIKQFLENTRFDTLRRQVRYIAEYLGSSYPDYVIQYVREAIEDYPDAQSEIEELKKVIEKTI